MYREESAILAHLSALWAAARSYGATMGPAVKAWDKATRQTGPTRRFPIPLSSLMRPARLEVTCDTPHFRGAGLVLEHRAGALHRHQERSVGHLVA